MPRYVIEEEDGLEGQPSLHDGPIDGLAVARALAQKFAQESERPVLVRNMETSDIVARFEPMRPPSEEAPLARSVRRMRAANDRLKQALNSPSDRGPRK
jgi:hypothetical protein